MPSISPVNNLIGLNQRFSPANSFASIAIVAAIALHYSKDILRS